ncbi:MAG: YebG family protein [gamma proteobacterium symbiont of Taylorina sp.]|nr:YebG family protein [gamma proteobacterium symbiont of Taylorina sp.]
MSIKLEYIVCNKKGDELKRFDIKADAEAYDSVICAAEDISVLLEPLQKQQDLTEDQIYAISEHLAFQSDEVKLALKQIKKPKVLVNVGINSNDSTASENSKKVSLAKLSTKKSPK